MRIGMLLILRGKTGSGKSTLLELIVQNYQFRNVEIDKIKLAKYGTTTRCVPETDFEEAGLQAKKYLLNGESVVVEEAFLDRRHIQYLLNGLGEVATRVLYIRLECSVESALARKTGVLDEGVVRSQHRRVIDDVDGELVFNTDTMQPDMIAIEIGNKL